MSAFPPRPRFAWKLRSRTLALGERTQIMAIVNLTPDSFSGDGLAARPVDECAEAAVAPLDCGADILDIGAESTRPGAQPISAGEEQARLLPVLEAVFRARPDALVSVDTYHAATARAAAQAGAEIINDVSGLLWEPAMAQAVAETGCGFVLMHTRGRPTEWRTQAPLAGAEVLPEVLGGLRRQLSTALAAGIAPECIVLDPGFGFGKVGAENLTLLAEFAQLHTLGYPLLAGVSRKGFLGEAVRATQPQGLPVAEARFVATAAANVTAALSGAHLLRVHDVQPAREAAALADALIAARTS